MNVPRSRPAPRVARGFVLPVTMILLALVAVGVALMAHRTDRLRSLVQASSQEQRAAAAVQSALAQAQYLVTTLQRGAARLGDIELDGRFYRGPEGTYVGYSDAASRLNLRRASAGEVSGLLRALGVAEGQAAVLADRLLDYADSDPLTRLNGAEEPEYVAARMPPPRNAQPITPDELLRVLGWNALDAATLRKVIDHVHLGAPGAANLNTVTAPVFAAVSGMDLDVATEVLSRRVVGAPVPIESMPEQAGGSYLAMARFGTLPSATTLLTVCHPDVAWCQQVSLTATPESGEAPWRIDYSVRRMRTAALPPPSQVAALPDQPSKQPPPPLMTPFGIFTP